MLELLAALHRFAQLLGAWTGDPFGVVFALLPDLILVIGAEGMVRVGSGAILRPKGAVLHLIDLCHFLENDLTLRDELAHSQSIV